VFERFAQAINIEVKAHAVHFPEREVLLAMSDVVTLDRLVAHSDVVAELRRAKARRFLWGWVAPSSAPGPTMC
jgi:hypothetical protein